MISGFQLSQNIPNPWTWSSKVAELNITVRKREYEHKLKVKEIEESSVQAIITSPPYWGLRDYDSDGQLGDEDTPEEFAQKLRIYQK